MSRAYKKLIGRCMQQMRGAGKMTVPVPDASCPNRRVAGRSFGSVCWWLVQEQHRVERSPQHPVLDCGLPVKAINSIFIQAVIFGICWESEHTAFIAF